MARAITYIMMELILRLDCFARSQAQLTINGIFERH
jgi:hypothetical protein